MKILIVVAPENFRDEEYTVPVDALEKAGIGFDVASTRRGTCSGMLGATAEATLAFLEVVPESYAGILIVGGSGAQSYLWDDALLRGMVKYFHQSGGMVAAICLAPVVLARAGILRGKNATVFPSPISLSEMRAGGAVLAEKAVVSDSRIVTANGPGAAKEFAGTVIRTLASGKA